ncbi:MAG: radical SAM protein [Candidatus Omnitrophica bacterium]|nr:radical SAM protein [Candidatus Omnitrophota bacterium]
MKRLKIPFEIIVEITGRCRLVCEHCTSQRTPHVPLETVLGILDECASFGVKAIRITGGEPFLHPDIEKILNYAKDKKFMVLLNTAAENMSPSLLKNVVKNVDMLLVSLQGYSPRTNAAYTGSKSPYIDKLKNIFFLRSRLPSVVLATVITHDMTKSFAKFLPLVRKINPEAWTLLRPIDTMTDNIKRMDVAFYRALAVQIMKARQEKVNVFIANPIPMCITGDLRIGKQAFYGANLDDGHVRIVYSAEGYYKPSYFINTNLGNALKAAWAHPALKELDRTDYLPELCHQCPVLDTCRGGCRGMSLRAHGTPFSPDPLFDFASAQKALSKPYLNNPVR